MKFLRKDFLLPMTLLFATIAAQAQVANFVANVKSGCFPLLVEFTDTSTGAVSSWNWDFGNSNSSILQNPSAIYASPGIYTVSLAVSNGAQSDTEIKTGYITVSAFPVVDFELENVVGCAPLKVTYRDITSQTSGEITDWLWVFGDGGTSATPVTEHVYLSPGQASVSLKVTNEFGCEATKSVLGAINIQGPIADFSAGDTLFCQVPAIINFLNKSSGDPPLTYLWDFGDGGLSSSTNQEHTFQVPGVYNVTLKATDGNGCSNEHKVNIKAGSEGGIDFQPSNSTVCVGEEINFTVQSESSILSRKWNFGNGTTSSDALPSVSFTQPGTYKVTLDVFLSGKTCHSIVQKSIQVLAPLLPTFTATQDCEYTIALENTTQNSYRQEWFIDNEFHTDTSTLNYTHGEPGDVLVRLVVYNELNCSNSTERMVHIISNPTAAFTPHLEQDCSLPSLSGCAPFKVDFKNATVSEAPYTVQWQFGNGGTSTVKNPSVTYVNPGVYLVKLKVTSTLGCVAVDSAKVTVANKKPAAKFSVPKTNYCVQEEVKFKDESVNATFWCWDFGDNSTGFGKEATHLYTVPGVYTVTLIVKNAGCSDSFELKNAIRIKDPYVGFLVGKNCQDPNTISLTNLSSNCDLLVWDFGDGTISSQPETSHHYNTLGNFDIKLKGVNNATHCEVNVTVPVVIQIIEAGLEVSNETPCKDVAIDFTSTSQDAVAWEWSFGNGKFSDLKNSQTSYITPGVYNVTLQATNSDGCTDQRSLKVTVPDIAGNFSFQGVSNCEELAVKFNDLSVSTPPIEEWYWEFGDGKTSTESNPDHTYTSIGTYPVVLKLTNSVGQCTFLEKSAVIFSRPVPDFSASKSNYCIGELISFSNLSVNAFYYSWDFGDGQNSSNSTADITYSHTGSFTVNLRATDNYGCEKSVTKSAFITITKPMANFDAFQTSEDCPPLTTLFENRSSVDVKIFSWDFGDGQMSSLASPANTYTKAGVFDVKLTVEDQYHCRDTIIMNDIVKVGGPSGSFEPEASSVCIGGEFSFNANAENTVLFEWDFGDGNVYKSTTHPVNHVYNSFGSFKPSLVISDQFGCEVLADGAPTVVVNDSAKIAIRFPICIFDKEEIQMRGSASEDVIWQWYVDDMNSIRDSPTFAFDSAGAYVVNAIATNANGCVSRISQMLNVQKEIDFLPNVITPNNDGKNDFFMVPDIDKGLWSLKIFNRWGELVHHSNGRYSNDWRGDGLATGQYFMSLENLVCPEKKYKGYITLVR